MAKKNKQHWLRSTELYDGIEQAAYNDLVGGYVAEAMSGIDPQYRDDPVVLNTLEAKGIVMSLFAMLKMGDLSDSYLFYAIEMLDDKDMWKYVAQDETWDAIEDFIEDILRRAGPSTMSDFKEVKETIKYLRDHGYPLNKAIAMLRKKSKLRAAAPMLRRKRLENNLEAVSAIIEEEILSKDVTVAKMRKQADGYRGQRDDFPKVPAANTSYSVIGGQGEGVVTIRVDNAAQAKAIETLLKGTVDDPEASFFPRDALAVTQEVAAALRSGPYEIRRTPYSMQELQYLQNEPGDQVKCVIPIDLRVIVNATPEQFESIITSLATEWPCTLWAWEVYGNAGYELHLLVTVTLLDPEVTLQ